MFCTEPRNLFRLAVEPAHPWASSLNHLLRYTFYLYILYVFIHTICTLLFTVYNYFVLDVTLFGPWHVYMYGGGGSVQRT